MTKNLITRMNRKLAPLGVTNDVTQLKLHERMNKREIWSNCDVICSSQNSYGETKNKAGQVLTQLKAISLTKRRKLDL